MCILFLVIAIPGTFAGTSVDSFLGMPRDYVAFLSDYDSYTFIVTDIDVERSVSNGTHQFWEYKITLDTQEGPGEQTITDWTAADGTTNYATCHYSKYYCDVVVGALGEKSVLQTGLVKVYFRTTGFTEELSAEYVLRNFHVDTSVGANITTLTGDTIYVDVGYETTSEYILTPNNMGYVAIPQSMDYYQSSTNDGNLHMIGITYDDNSYVLYGADPEIVTDFNVLIGTYTFPTGTHYVTSLEIRRYAADSGVCGLLIRDSNSGSSEVGCSTGYTTDEYTFTQTSKWFVGFMQISTYNIDDFYMLYPISYELLNVRVGSYTPQHDGIDFWMDVDWPSTSYEIQYTYLSALGSDGTLTYSTATVTDTSATSSVGLHSLTNVGTTSGVVPCSYMSVTFYDTGNVNSRHMEQDSSVTSYEAWTSGWSIDESMASDSIALYNGAGSNITYYSNNFYDEESSTSTCKFNYIYELGFDSTYHVLYVNGVWLGYYAGDAPSNLITFNNEVGQVITQITVYYDDNGALNGISATYYDSPSTTETVTVGSTAENSDILSPDSNGFITAIEADYDFTDNATTNIRVYTGYPVNIVLTNNEPVSDGSFYTSNGFAADYDADLQRIWWYNSADYYSVNLTVNGSFLDAYNYNFPNTYTTNTVARGGVASAIIRHLVADSDYVLNEGAFNAIFETYAYGNIEAIDGDFTQTALSWTQPDGVQWSCALDGSDMTAQIEYEALPEIAIAWHSSSGPDTEVGTMTNIATFALEQYDESDDYFQYGTNDQEYPRYQDFFGYPIAFMAYWNTTVADGCIHGVAFSYYDREAVEHLIYLAGSGTEYDALSTSGELGSEETSFIDLTVSTDYALDGNCISGIQFRNSSGINPNNCIGPATTCSNTGPSAETALPDGSPAFYLYSFDVHTDSNGNYVYGFDGNFVSVDFPTLVPYEDVSSSCYLEEYIDYNYIRDSAWYLSYNIADNPDQCGTLWGVYNKNDNQASLHADQDTTKNDHGIVYNQLISRVQDNVTNYDSESGTGVMISRRSDWQVSGFCYYNAEGQVSTYYTTDTEADYTVTNVQNLDLVEMYVYTDNTYSTAYSQSTTPVMDLGEPVYMTIEHEYDDMVISARSCWASQDMSADSHDDAYYDLLLDGCGTDSTFAIDTTASTDSMYAFQFDAFAWYESNAIQTSTVYIHCEYRLCPTVNGTMTYCNQTTDNCSQRKRRNVSPALEVLGIKESTVTASQALVFVNRRDTEILKVHRDPYQSPQQTSLVAGFSAFVVTMMLFSTILVAYRIYRVRKAYHILKVNAGSD